MTSTVIYNITNTTSRPTGPVDPVNIFGAQRDPMYIVIPVTLVYSFVFIAGLFGNVFTCLVIIKNKSMHTATNFYLFSLAVSDLLLLISGMPQEMYSIWVKWPYVFGPAFCVIRGLAAETSTNASVLTITLFTIERYLAICHPFVSHKMSKLSRATKHVVVLWVVSLALALPQALQFGVRSHGGVAMCLQTRTIIEHSFEISTFLFFFAPMLLITILYTLIGLRLRKSDISKEVIGQDSIRNMRFSPGVRRKQSQSAKRVIKMLVAVVVAFFLCWAPFHAQRLVAIYGTDEHHRPRSELLLQTYTVLTYISGVFYYFSTSINPILYHIMSNKFRDAFKNSLVRCCGARARPAQRGSYSTVAGGRQPASLGSGHSGNKYKSGTSKSSGSKSGSQNSSTHKEVKLEADSRVDNYKLKPKKSYLDQGNDGVTMAIDKSGNTSICKDGNWGYSVAANKPGIFVVPNGDRVKENTQDENKAALSNEPEVYIRVLQEKTI